MDHLDETVARALDRGAQLQRREPRAVAVRLDAVRSRLVVDLLGGVEVAIPIALLGLGAAADLTGVRVEGGGFDLYFPAIDEGAYVPDLIRMAVEVPRAA